MWPRAVLFDLDGVLVKSEEAWFLTLEAAGKKFRGRAITREEFMPTFGQGTAADVGAFGLHCSVAELDAFYRDEFVKRVPSVWVNPDAKRVLSGVKHRGLSCAVVTNSIAKVASRLLEHAQLSGEFDMVATADQVANAKPAPDLLLHACRGLGLAPVDTWLVGDSRFDLGAAGAAGAYFVGFGIDGEARIDTLDALLTLLQHAATGLKK